MQPAPEAMCQGLQIEPAEENQSRVRISSRIIAV